MIQFEAIASVHLHWLPVTGSLPFGEIDSSKARCALTDPPRSAKDCFPRASFCPRIANSKFRFRENAKVFRILVKIL